MTCAFDEALDAVARLAPQDNEPQGAPPLCRVLVVAGQHHIVDETGAFIALCKTPTDARLVAGALQAARGLAELIQDIDRGIDPRTSGTLAACRMTIATMLP